MLYHIVDNVYLSNLNSALNVGLLIENNIQIVCRLSEDINVKPESYAKLNSFIEYYNFEIEDNFLYKYDIVKHSEAIYNIISNNKNKNILVHCNEGQSRSVSAVIHYICQKYDVRAESALDIIKQIKKDAGPNSAFMYELSQLHMLNNVDKDIRKLQIASMCVVNQFKTEEDSEYTYTEEDCGNF